jgi:hypothetical protein
MSSMPTADPLGGYAAGLTFVDCRHCYDTAREAERRNPPRRIQPMTVDIVSSDSGMGTTA